MGKKGEDLSGTRIKDAWTKPNGGRMEGGRWGWLGLGGSGRGKWRQLYLKNNKKKQKHETKDMFGLKEILPKI